jgi:hypothetical protein
MKTVLRLCLVLGVFLLLHVRGFAGQESYEVPLSVVHNGRPSSLPFKVVVKNRGRSITVPVKAGHILVPVEMATGPALTIQARIGHDIIRIPGIPVSALGSSWKIVLADESFGEDYENALPKGTNVRSACLIVFEPKRGDGTVLGVSNCRKPIDK